MIKKDLEHEKSFPNIPGKVAVRLKAGHDQAMAKSETFAQVYTGRTQVIRVGVHLGDARVIPNIHRHTPTIAPLTRRRCKKQDTVIHKVSEKYGNTSQKDKTIPGAFADIPSSYAR